MGWEAAIQTTSAERVDSPPNAREQGVPAWRALALNLLVVLAIGLGAALRVWGAGIGGDVADVSAYRHHVHLVLDRDMNVYLADTRYPYFPGWLAVELTVWDLARRLNMQFWWLIRLVIVAADVLVCLAVWWVATRTGGAARGRWAGAIYALSPIAVLISGHHGQFDAVPTLFSILAVGVLIGARPRAWAAGLLLGVAMALKPFPALLVPVFGRQPGLAWPARLLIAALAGLVVLAVTLEFLLIDAMAVYRNVAGYPGLNDQGLGGLLRALWLYRSQNVYLPGAFGIELATTTRWTALALMAFALAALWKHPAPRVAAAVYLAFLAVFGGVSTQYLVWPLAWLLISDVPLRWAVLYSLGATAGAVGFYLVYWPQMLIPGPWKVPAVQHVGFFIAGQAVALVATWATFGAAVAPGLRGGGWRRPAVLLAALLCLATAYPVARQVIYLAGEWLKLAR